MDSEGHAMCCWVSINSRVYNFWPTFLSKARKKVEKETTKKAIK
jgi:hypothetical protein